MVKVTIEFDGETVVKEGDFVYAVVAKDDGDDVDTNTIIYGSLKGMGIGELMVRNIVSSLKKINERHGGRIPNLADFFRR